MLSERESFNASLKSLEQWFNKPLKSEQYIQFAQRLKFIPPQALKDIVERIIDDNPPTPGRFPTVTRIKQGWEVWKQENPSKVFRPPKTPCASCHSHGFIWFYKHDEEANRDYQFVARCGSCENWLSDASHNSPIPRMHIQEIVAKGYQVVSFTKNAGSWPPQKGGVNKLAAETLHDMPTGVEHYNKVQSQADEILRGQP